MGSNILDIATSSLRVAKQKLEVTSHNIANVNTEGYSRQRVNANARPPQFSGAGFMGSGVKVTSIERAYDKFLTNRVRATTSSFAEVDRFYQMTSKIDNIIADPDLGVAKSMENFFNAVHDVADDPTSLPARQTLLTEADTLTDRFHTLSGQLDAMESQIQQETQDHVNEINSLAEQIATLNEKIVYEVGKSQGKPPNDLLDQRDALINQLSEKIDVSPLSRPDGAVDIFIGKGHALVMGADRSTLGLQANPLDPDKRQITLTNQFHTMVIDEGLSGGELGGLIQFREQVMIPTENKLGRLAAGLMVEFNQLHKAGYDLDGNTGVDFFTMQAPEIPITQEGTGTVTASYVNIADLEASDYQLAYDGSAYTLTRLSDQTQTTISSFPATVDGIEIDLASPPTGPSTFLIRPTQQAAGKISLNISDPRQFAAAQTDTSTGSIGDNSNALEMAWLESAKKMLGGTATFQDSYGQIVAEIGTTARSAKISRNAREVIKNQATTERESLSGVNLDEEAANLLKFQQAYQASAQVIAIASQTFDALLGAVRR
ncbi:MAG: hypothetical protein AXA67_03970 [Methylothermaceae bacteria B42]|nr:MAG: hypothetical protein AXA67_03970 [Methylothermaceae bacteria B42]HHJ38601.1 flagellar hook-associated protein FlgK [Methylothermaceae bacterium]